MPFVKKTDSQGSRPPTDVRKIFIGREGELLFFRQNILKPEDPTHNIISITGQGGVGKSTLLARYRDETHAPEFKDYCLTALVDERQTTPLSMMEKFAEQLHLSGEFEKALKSFKQTLRSQEAEGKTLQETLWQRTPDFAGAAVEGIPFAGPILREATKATTAHLLSVHYTNRLRKDVERLEDPIDDLTKAFVTELNHLADSKITLSSYKTRQLRVILFFDTFEQLAPEAVPWLLDYFLEAEINKNVVLVIAGRDPIEHSTPESPKRWLPLFDNETIYSISLSSFTEDETRNYLVQRGITDPERIATVWQLSRGLPLYLGLLTSNPQGKVDPMKDVVDNFLRWIPEHEQNKRQLALDAALFSRPFNQDDLEAYAYLSEDERPVLYRWLIGQPFVRSQEGRYRYHELAQDLFNRYLHQRSKKGYYASRKALAVHYQHLLEKIQEEGGKEIYHSAEWFELSLALVYQLLLLSDEVSHIKAIAKVLNTYKHTNSEEQEKEIVRVLHELSRRQSNNRADASTIQITTNLQHIIEADRESVKTADRSRLLASYQKLLAATNYLLTKVVDAPSFPHEELANIYLKRSDAFFSLEEPEKGFEDLKHTIELVPAYASAYASRGVRYRLQGAFQQAIEDLDLAVKLEPTSAFAYAQRGMTYSALNDYQRAIQDFNRALERGKAPWIYVQRGKVYRNVKEFRRAIEDFDQAIALKTKTWQDAAAYNQRGRTYRMLGEYGLALNDFHHAFEHDPHYSKTYSDLGITYLWMKDVERAKSSYAQGWDANPKTVRYGWMVEWSNVCLVRPDSEMSQRLEKISSIDPRSYLAHVTQGVVHWIRQQFEEALTEQGQAIQLDQEQWDAYFWNGLVNASLGRYKEAMAAIEKSLELGLPPVLLAPLRWFEQDRPAFYQKFVSHLLARYELTG